MMKSIQKLLEKVLQEKADLLFSFLNEEDLKSAKNSKLIFLRSPKN